MTNQKLFDLLIEIRDSDIFAPTKYDYRERGIGEPMKLAHAYNLIEEFGKRGGNYRLTKNGYAVIDSNGDLSVLDSPSISIRSDNAHVGDNYGNYNQSSSTNKSVTKNAAALETATIKKIFIGLIVTVIGGLIIWYLTTHIF